MKGLRLIAVLVAFASVSSLYYGCSGTEMAGGAATAQTKKAKPKVSNPGSTSSDALGCISSSVVANSDQEVEMELTGLDGLAKVSVQDNIGTAEVSGSTLKYKAPNSVMDSRDVILTVTSGSKSSKCTVKLIGKDRILIPDDGTSRALKANVYQLRAGSKSMAQDFDGKNIPPIPGIYMAPNVDVPSQPSNLGFPGMHRSVNTEDYVISFFGKIIIPEDGRYEFKVIVDDGAVMWINDTKVIDADGQDRKNPILKAKEQGSIQLTKGEQRFKLNYYQGPACCIAVILQWKPPGQLDFTTVPASFFDRSDD